MRKFTPAARFICTAASGLAILAATACNTDNNEPADTAVTATDATGHPISLSGPAERVACLTMICIDALKELGLTPVAYREDLAVDPRYFGADTDMRKITGGFGEENVEDIALSEPDLVVGLGGVQDGLREAVQAVAPLYLTEPKSWQESVQFLRTLGELTGRQTTADDAAQAFTERVEAARSQRSDLTTMSMYGEPGALGVDSLQTPVGSLLAEVSDYPWPAGTDAFATVSVEQIADVDPDVVFAQAFSSGNDSEGLSSRLSTNPMWSTISAARNHRVIEVDADVWATGRGTISLGLVLDEALPALAPAR